MRLHLMRILRLRIIFGAPSASKCPAGAELLKGRLVQRPHIDYSARSKHTLKRVQRMLTAV